MANYTFPTTRLVPLKEGVTSNTVLISCGTFNPITYLHMRIFETAKDHLQSECGHHVVGGFLSPVHDDYAKRKLTLDLSAVHRVKMCELALADSEWIAVDSWETQQSSFVRTRQALAHFKQHISEALSGGDSVRVMLLCGADVLESMTKQGVWIEEDVHHILGHHGVVVVERSAGSESASLQRLVHDSELLYRYRKNIIIVPQFITNDISSTQIRLLVRRGLSTKYLIPDSVRKYINDENLYKGE